jgi:hypothetical protein
VTVAGRIALVLAALSLLVWLLNLARVGKLYAGYAIIFIAAALGLVAVCLLPGASAYLAGRRTHRGLVERDQLSSVAATAHDALLRVEDEMSFIAFLQALSAAAPGAPGLDEAIEHPWKNLTIAAFLEAGAAWGSDSRDAPMLPPTARNPWRRCADMLWAATVYE